MPPEVEGLHVSQRGTVGKNMVYPPMERSDQQDFRLLRIARHKANGLMMHFERQMAAKDLDGALDSLVEARMHYAGANDKQMVSDLEALMARLHGDLTVEEINKARQQQKYDDCVRYCKVNKTKRAGGVLLGKRVLFFVFPTGPDVFPRCFDSTSC